MEFWFFIAVIAITFGYFDYRHKMKDLELKVNNSEKVNLEEELQSIKHRLVVLEKIVTDRRYQLEEEIDKL